MSARLVLTECAEDFLRLKKLIEPVGTSLRICRTKLYPAHPEENKHVEGHHVGSWSFVARKQQYGAHG